MKSLNFELVSRLSECIWNVTDISAALSKLYSYPATRTTDLAAWTSEFASICKTHPTHIFRLLDDFRIVRGNNERGFSEIEPIH